MYLGTCIMLKFKLIHLVTIFLLYVFILDQKRIHWKSEVLEKDVHFHR